MYHREVKATTYNCAYCGETNHTVVDPSQGKTQKYIEDCPRSLGVASPIH